MGYFTRYANEIQSGSLQADFYQKELDVELENCVGKYADSYEYALDTFHQRMQMA